jgi:hypothetical protein
MKDECDRAEAALDRHYGRTRRIYEKVMADEHGLLYLELAPGRAQAGPSAGLTPAAGPTTALAVSGGACTTAPRTSRASWTPSARSRERIAADAYAMPGCRARSARCTARDGKACARRCRAETA